MINLNSILYKDSYGKGGIIHFCITYGDDISIITEGMKRLEE